MGNDKMKMIKERQNEMIKAYNNLVTACSNRTECINCPIEEICDDLVDRDHHTSFGVMPIIKEIGN